MIEFILVILGLGFLVLTLFTMYLLNKIIHLQSLLDIHFQFHQDEDENWGKHRFMKEVKE